MRSVMEGSAVSRVDRDLVALRIVDGGRVVTVYLSDEAAREVSAGIDAIVT